MEKEDLVRKELLALLTGDNAHMTFEEAVDEFPLSGINGKMPNMPYSAWHILEHMRRAQEDIVWFIQDPDYVSPPWPEAFFPSPAETIDAAGWEESVRGFLKDRAVLEEMARDRQTDLYGPVPHAKTYTIYREILLAADHNAYHTGELALIRQVLQAWPPGQVLYDAAG